MTRTLQAYACCGGTLTSGHLQDCKQQEEVSKLDTKGTQDYLLKLLAANPRENL